MGALTGGRADTLLTLTVAALWVLAWGVHRIAGALEQRNKREERQ